MDLIDYSQVLDEAGRLRPEYLPDLLVEIITGKHLFEVHSTIYASVTPTSKQQDTARLVYARRFAECRTARLPTRKEMEALAAADRVFDPLEVAEKLAITRNLDRLIKARDTSTSAVQKKALEVQIMTYRKRLEELMQSEERVYQNCAESRADDTRIDYLASCCTLQGDFLDQPVWPTWEDYLHCEDRELVLESRKAHLRVSFGLPVNIVRALARTPEWRQRWRAAKESESSVFEGSSASWDHNKLNIVAWSDFFDSVLKHPECPSEELIQNDEQLEAWVNAQLEAAKQRKKTTPGGSGRPMMVTDPKTGKKRAMTSLGSKTIKVNQSYRVRE